jgi:hypothetical protein
MTTMMKTQTVAFPKYDGHQLPHTRCTRLSSSIKITSNSSTPAIDVADRFHPAMGGDCTLLLLWHTSNDLPLPLTVVK